jgi:hypothetical protein
VFFFAGAYTVFSIVTVRTSGSHFSHFSHCSHFSHGFVVGHGFGLFVFGLVGFGLAGFALVGQVGHTPIVTGPASAATTLNDIRLITQKNSFFIKNIPFYI